MVGEHTQHIWAFPTLTSFCTLHLNKYESVERIKPALHSASIHLFNQSEGNTSSYTAAL